MTAEMVGASSAVPSRRRGAFHRGDRLRKAREQAGIQVQQMALLMGVERGTIRRYERDVGVKRMVIGAYARFTDHDPVWLEYGEDGPPDGGEKQVTLWYATNTLDTEVADTLETEIAA